MLADTAVRQSCSICLLSTRCIMSDVGSTIYEDIEDLEPMMTDESGPS